MRLAFVNLGLVGLQIEHGVARKRLQQQSFVVQMVELAGAAGVVLELRGRIALQQQRTAGL